MDEYLITLFIFITTKAVGPVDLGHFPSYSENPLECEVDGVYPHLDDCNGAYSCRNGILRDHPCPPGTQYLSVKQDCLPFGETHACKRNKLLCRPDCSGKSEEYVEHPANDKIYIRCVNSSPKSIHICPEGTQFRAERNPPCDVACESRFYLNKQNIETYYKCIKMGDRTVHVAFYCPDGRKLRYMNEAVGFKCVRVKNK